MSLPEPDDARRAQLARALQQLEQRIAAACHGAGRRRDDVTLVAVTKFHPAADVAALHALGVHDVGESRAQEAQAKRTALAGLDLRWHLIGRLQRNKARTVAATAHLVHSLDSARLASALDDAARRVGRTLPVLVQVSLDGDPARGGVPVAQLRPLAEQVASLDGLQVRGVMAVLPRGADPARSFGELAALAGALRQHHPRADLLSAGMSGDLEAAVEAGATHLRVGTALLGPRPEHGR